VEDAPMIARRIQPILVVLAVLASAVLLRLYQIQIGEGPVWQAEAARLVHSGREIPYHRGRILEAEGRVLAADRDGLELVLIYREFRRNHPLGQVAHARSLLEGRAVSLAEARGRLVEWGRELVALAPRDLTAYARGEGLVLPSLGVPSEASDQRAELLRARASDVGFYARRLLGLEGADLIALEKLVREAPEEERSLLELAASVLARHGPARAVDLARGIDERLARSLAGIARLARQLGTSEEELHGELELARDWVEDATASRLFSEAAGFAPGRLAPAVLLANVDLGWIADELAWDDARLARWAARARAGWLSGWRDGYALPHLAWHLVLDERPPTALDFLARARAVLLPEGSVEAVLDGDVPDVREPRALEVVEELADLFDAAPPPELDPAAAPALPLDFAAYPTDDAPAEAAWDFLDRCWNAAPDPEAGQGEALGRAIERHLRGRRSADVDALVLGLRARLDDWEVSLQDFLGRTLARMRERAERGELAPSGALRISRERRTRARERAEFFLKDYGTRAWPLSEGAPDYAVVYLVSRYARDYPGLDVREVRSRELAVYSGDGGPLAAGLVGRVSSVGVRDLVAQRDEARRMRGLLRDAWRSASEDEELGQLLGTVVHGDEVKGVSGVEAFLQPELVGRNGFQESRGLEDVFGERGGRAAREAVDGEDVRLTLDLELQRAAVRTLHDPVVPEDDSADQAWLANPVGAIVLLSRDGDVLAAVSEPNELSMLGDDARGQRAIVLERTLQKPTFQPPGSVMKMFWAAYAISEVGLDPRLQVDCAPIERGGCGYKDVRCHASHGHGVVDLDQALERSCNAYFAWLGETLSDTDLRRAAEMFGFGEPTGVRRPPFGQRAEVPRGGLVEHRAGLREGTLSDFDRRLAGNGLGPIEATPMQLARGTLALATGELGELRLVSHVGERELPRGQRRALPLAPAALERVRADLVRVAANPEGTAHAALAPETLGFAVAVKTGSADLTSRKDEEGKPVVRKHTWVAGWLPPREPELVFVVFVHDTMATSSHGAIYLARDLLTQPEVLAWLAGRGLSVPGVEPAAGSR
jgi:cell division protein FtsI/penicillin-binding protein 2